jgi:hypothetical protein
LPIIAECRIQPAFCRFNTPLILPIGVLLTHHLNFKNMRSNIFKSIGAVVAGLVFIFITHSATDFILESAGILPKGHLHVGAGLILFVIFYRAVLSLLGCYLTAKLAPKKPMKHALILGCIGTVLSAAAAVATANMNLGPAWYAWSLVVISLPVAWLGGKLYEIRNPNTVVAEM